MQTLFFIILFAILFLWGLKEYYHYKLKIGPDASPAKVVDELIALCKELNASGNFLDVGSGWGSIIAPMAQALPDWTFYGIEKSPTPWFISQFKTGKNKYNNISLLLGNAEKFRYKGYDIIYLNVPKRLLNEIQPLLIRNIRRGALVITYRNKIDGLEPFNSISVRDKKRAERLVHLYANTVERQKPVEPKPVQEEQKLPPEEADQPSSVIPEQETPISEPKIQEQLELEPMKAENSIEQKQEIEKKSRPSEPLQQK